ncbi:hypothetical protein [Glycomyces salinus]|uniref:hypothetical protein n=1 Tax=Glycomyces salinus TaxID=980294 RepID=UPI0018EC67EE|nr:hypothetical protein [Glycomyces salinus]
MRFNLFRKLFFAVAGNALSALAVVAALVPTLRWAGFALALAALGVVWRQHRLEGLSESRVARVAAVIALVAASVGAAGATTALPMLAAGSVLLLLLGNEQLLQIAIATRHVETVNLPVSRSGLEQYFTPRAAYGTIGAVTLVLAVAAGALVFADLTWPSWVALVTALGLCAALAAGTLSAWRRRRSSAHSGDPAVHEAVRALEPEFLIHFSGPPGSEYQIKMWLPYFDRLGDSYLIVLRDRTHLAQVRASTSAPVAIVPGVAALERLLVPSVKAVFYVNNSMQNTQLVRFGHLTHVQLMHGDSDKAASSNPVAAMYDRVFVAGQAGIDRYLHHGVDIPERKFRVVGRPQLHGIAVGPKRPADNAPVVLYTPTWTGISDNVNYSSLRLGQIIVSALLERGAVVLLRAHPYTRYNPASALQLAELERMLASDTERTGRPHRWGTATSDEMSLVDCINAADAAVSDISGAASDWLYSGKPLALTDVHGKGPEFETEFPLAKAAYRIGPDAGNMAAVVEELLGTDSAAPRREEVRAYYLGSTPPDQCVAVFLDAARDCYRPDPGERRPRRAVQSVPSPTQGELP